MAIIIGNDILKKMFNPVHDMIVDREESWQLSTQSNEKQLKLK